jgi:hypothetical protein
MKAKGYTLRKQKNLVQLDTLDIRPLGWLESSLIDEYIKFERRVIIHVLYYNIRNDWNKR